MSGQTYHDVLDEQAAAYGDKLFVRADSEDGPMTEVSYAEMDRRSRGRRGAAAAWSGAGGAGRDRGTEQLEWLAFFFGAVRAGYPVVTLNVR